MVLREKMCDVCKKQSPHKQVDFKYAEHQFKKQNEGDQEKMQNIVVASLGSDDHDYWECQVCGTISITPKGSLL